MTEITPEQTSEGGISALTIVVVLLSIVFLAVLVALPYF